MTLPVAGSIIGWAPVGEKIDDGEPGIAEPVTAAGGTPFAPRIRSTMTDQIEIERNRQPNELKWTAIPHIGAHQTKPSVR